MPSERGADHYSASELGQCARASIATRLGYKPAPAPDKWEGEGGYYERGHELEKRCIELMRNQGWSVGNEQREVALRLLTTSTMVTGHIDGLCVAPNSTIPRVLEVKSPGPWTRFGEAISSRDFSDPLIARYAWQISVYMLAMNYEADIATIDSNGNLLHFLVTRENIPYSLGDITGRVIALDRWVELGQLPPCNQRDFPCAFNYLHEDPPLEADPEVEKILSHYSVARQIAADATHVADEERAKLEHLMETRGVTTIKTVEGTVSRVSRVNEVLDRKALKRDLGEDRLDQYIKRNQLTYTRITLLDPKVGEET